MDEAALSTRLADMTRPGRGERAIILYDPTYYPGITTRLREELHRRGVFTYVLVEETPAIIESYADDETRHARQELDAIEALTPLFARADIFYWMPTRGYVDDLRWERLVERMLVTDTIPRAGADVRGARLVLRRGRVVGAEAREGLESIHRAFRRVGPDGEKVATVWLNTHPLTERYGLRVELGSNWENGGRNRTTGARRLAIALPVATVTADGVAILKDGRILWESISGGRWR